MEKEWPMAGTKAELLTYVNWAQQRIGHSEDPRVFWAFVKHVHDTGGDISRLGDYGWPNSVIIREPVYLPNE